MKTNKNILKILMITLLIVLGTILLSTKCYAATMSVSASKSSVSPGETFTVTVSVSNGAGSVNLSASNGSVSSGSAWLDNSSQSFTCTAGSSGTTKISVSGNFADYSTGEDEATKYGSASVTIVQPSNNSSSSGSSSSSSSSSSSKSSSSSSSSSTKKTTNNTQNNQEEEKSSNALLASISIKNEGVVITPEFANDVLEYTINIPNEINELDIIATPEDENATVEIKGNTDLKVGENSITIDVTAEDETKQIYTIKVIKAREKLALKTLVIKYEDENGEIKELVLTPEFISNIYEYSLGNLSYKISKILIEATANLEGATIEISGNENLVAGENIITITVKIPKETQNLENNNDEVEELAESDDVNPVDEEIITYTIKLNKEEAPSFWQRIKDKIKGFFGIIGNWFNNNQKPIVMYSLVGCIVAMLGLSIYIVFDIKKYKMLIDKLGKVSHLINLEAKAENASTSEIKSNLSNNEIGKENDETFESVFEDNSVSENENIIENIAKKKNINYKQDRDDDLYGNSLYGRRGRHF